MIKYVATVAIAALLAVAPASAATFDLTYRSDGSTFTGTLTTSATANAQGYYTITGLTGMRGSSVVSLLAAGAFPSLGSANDNLFSTTSPYFTSKGLSYSAGGTYYNLYSGLGSVMECKGPTAEYCDGGGSNLVNSLRVTAAVPEPAAWAMMLVGFGMVGAASRYRRRNVKASLA